MCVHQLDYELADGSRAAVMEVFDGTLQSQIAMEALPAGTGLG